MHAYTIGLITLSCVVCLRETNIFAMVFSMHKISNVAGSRETNIVIVLPGMYDTLLEYI